MEKTKVFLIIQTLICILVVLMLSAGAVKIYKEGLVRKAENPLESVYTPEEVYEKGSAGFHLLLIGLGFSLCGILFGVSDKNADKAVKDTRIMRDLTVKRVAVISDEMKAERMIQERIRKTAVAFFIICMIPVFIYLVVPSHFAESDAIGLEIVIRRLALHVFPWVILAMGGLAVSAVLEEKSMQRENDAALKRIKEEKEEGIKKEEDSEALKESESPETLLQRFRAFFDTPEGVKKARYALLCLAVLCIIIGIFNGSMKDVLVKAIKICTECVGLG